MSLAPLEIGLLCGGDFEEGEIETTEEWGKTPEFS